MMSLSLITNELKIQFMVFNMEKLQGHFFIFILYVRLIFSLHDCDNLLALLPQPSVVYHFLKRAVSYATGETFLYSPVIYKYNRR